jgi:hypothetical protein
VIYFAKEQESIAEVSKRNEMAFDKIVIVKVLELVSHKKMLIIARAQFKRSERSPRVPHKTEIKPTDFIEIFISLKSQKVNSIFSYYKKNCTT